MKTLVKSGLLAMFALSSMLYTSCEVKEDPTTDLEQTIPDFRDNFTGEFDFAWTHTVTRDGQATVTQGTHTGLIAKNGTDMVDVNYRPEAMRRMIITSAGVLTDAVASQDGFFASGSFSDDDNLSLSISSTSGNAEVHLQITGVRK